jgi:hypothetical protein
VKRVAFPLVVALVAVDHVPEQRHAVLRHRRADLELQELRLSVLAEAAGDRHLGIVCVVHTV